jgi:hypothetical protein
VHLLIYAMQSSGASSFCCFLGQRPDSVAVVDVWSRGITPAVETQYPVVAKATVNMLFAAEDHIKSFAPDRTLLFVRDPLAVYASLIKYDYANRFGAIDDKLARFDSAFAAGGYDAVIRYEDFVARDPAVLQQIDGLGWPCDPSYYEMRRGLQEIARFNCAASRGLANSIGNGWGFGNVRPGPIRQDLARRPNLPDLDARIAELSPVLYDHYQAFWAR